MPEVISIGPLALPPYLLVALAVGLGALVGLRAGARDEQTRRILEGRINGALLIFILVWKLSPAFSLLPELARDPLALLRIPAGPLGTTAALACGMLYLFLPARRAWRRFLAPAGAFVLVGAVAGVLAVQVLTAAAGSQNPHRRELYAAQQTHPTAEGGFAPLIAPNQAHVITVWATWCGPCRADVPVKRAVAEQLTEPVRFVGMNLTSTEASADSVREYADRFSLPYPSLLDPTGELADRLAVRGTPTTIVTNRDGTVVDRWVGPTSVVRLESAIASALAQAVDRNAGLGAQSSR